MNYLEICRRTNDIVGFQSDVASVDTTGYQATLTAAVKDAYEDIQRYRPDWNFMKAKRSINVSNLATEYSLETLWAGDTVDLAEWQYINYDYRRLGFIHYDTFVLTDFSGYNNKEPRGWSVVPATKDLLITPVDQVYTLEAHYIRTLHELSGNNSVPILPKRFHQLIVYSAIMKLSTFVGNLTLYDTYSMKTSMLMGQLMREENPAKVVRKRPLA